MRTRRIRIAILLASIAAALLSVMPHAVSHGTADVLPPSAASDQ